MKKRPFVLTILAAMALFLTACSDQSVEEGRNEAKQVNLLFNFATSLLDPHVDTSYVPVRAGITETLVYLNDETLEIEPWLAESWSSDDGQN
ncbi:hypothetical protein [Planococcus sp. ISL-109]|uniref:hypothetical protein n=1 Tax=Planococcus sp. ISL-109 TaxID=2819166 RepID=UPI00333A77EE